MRADELVEVACGTKRLAHLALLERGQGGGVGHEQRCRLPGGRAGRDGHGDGLGARSRRARCAAAPSRGTLVPGRTGAAALDPGALQARRSAIVSIDVTSTSSFSTRDPLEVVVHEVGDGRGHQRRRLQRRAALREEVLDAHLAPAAEQDAARRARTVEVPKARSLACRTESRDT